MKRILLTIFFGIILLNINYARAQNQQIATLDSVGKAKSLLQEATVKSSEKAIEITIRNVDISKFPEINVIIEALNVNGYPIDTLNPNELTVMENGVEKKVMSVQKISVKERVPVDFVFAIDITGSMQKYIDAVKSNISGFATNLIRRGIDYRIGLILFNDFVEKVYQPTENISTFLSWLSNVRAYGGGDEKENALEALREATKIQYRPSANKVVVIITDAPYHQAGEQGEGTTNLTTNTAINMLTTKEVRLFSIVPPKLKEYKMMSQKTRGTAYDLDYPFSTILDNFSNQLTNLFALKYRTDQPAIPDSINIALLNSQKKELVRKTIPIVELGRKLIIENLLYETNSYALPDSVQELEILTQFMLNKPNVTILVEGHTDGRGSHEKNDLLSMSRAESVKSYLIRRGIKAARIKTIGYGKRKPIADNNTEFGRKLNRRTEIVIVSK